MTQSKPAAVRSATLTVGLLAALASTGCTYRYRWSLPTAMSRRSIGAEVRKKVAPEAAFATLRIDGTRLRVSTVRKCEWVSVESIETTYAYHETAAVGPKTSQDREASANLIGVIGGGASLATGLVLLPMGIGEFGDAQASGNPVLVAGAVTTGVGALLLGLSFLPARKLTDKRVAEITEHEHESSRPCRAEPEADVPVLAVAGSRVVLLGTSDSNGVVFAELTTLLEPRKLLDEAARTPVSLRLPSERGGATANVDEVALYGALESAVWGIVARDRCATERTYESCDEVGRYLALYPDGAHAEEARGLRAAIVETFEGGEP